MGFSWMFMDFHGIFMDFPKIFLGFSWIAPIRYIMTRDCPVAVSDGKPQVMVIEDRNITTDPVICLIHRVIYLYKKLGDIFLRYI